MCESCKTQVHNAFPQFCFCRVHNLSGFMTVVGAQQSQAPYHSAVKHAVNSRNTDIEQGVHMIKSSNRHKHTRSTFLGKNLASASLIPHIL